MFDIQEEITTPVKFWGKIVMTDGVFTLVFFNYARELTGIAYQPFQFPSLIFLFGMYLFWLFPSKRNKGKRNYHRLIYILGRNRQTYYSIEYYSYSQDEQLDESVESDEELSFYDIEEKTY